MANTGSSRAGKEYLYAGAVLFVLGAWCLFKYYEGSGRSRPFLTKFLPG